MDIRDSSLGELHAELARLQDAIATIHDDDRNAADLIRGVYNIRQEMIRRDRALPLGSLWTVTDLDTPTPMTRPEPFNLVKMRNGRGGPGGPGGWDD